MAKMRKLTLHTLHVFYDVDGMNTSPTQESKPELTSSVWDNYAQVWIPVPCIPSWMTSDEFLNLSQSQFPYLHIVDAEIINPNIDLL